MAEKAMIVNYQLTLFLFSLEERPCGPLDATLILFCGDIQYLTMRLPKRFYTTMPSRPFHTSKMFMCISTSLVLEIK